MSFSCTPAPHDCSGWYRSNVSIDWTVLPSTAVVTGCQDRTYTTDTPGADEFCSANDGSTTVTVELKIRLDKTPPVVTGGQPARGADVDGWYNRPVGVAFSGSDQTSGVAACTSTTYSGPDSGAASLAGTCTDNAGNASAPFGYGLKYDATAPVISGAAPDHPANASVTYSVPDAANAGVTGLCSDRAGNSTGRAFALKYDATAPAVADLNATAGDRSVALSWQASPDADSVEVARAPGIGSEPASVVFRGPGTAFVDGAVDNGVSYSYEVRVRDPAGNAGSATVTAIPAALPAPVGGGAGAPTPTPTPTPAPGVAPTGKAPSAAPPARRRLLPPANGVVLRAGRPPLLQWTPVKGARYYNVQLFRDGRKILSVWPLRPRYQLERHWSYRGALRRLAPAKYRWLVWPGFGPRSKADYGVRIGPSTFEVRRSRAAGGR